MSELVKIYSPEGEPFEVSKANARDLTTHAGWSYAQAGAAAPTAPAEPEVVEEETETEETETEETETEETETELTDTEQEDEADAQEGSESESEAETGTDESGSEEAEGQEPVSEVLTSEEDFADFEKEDVVKYLEDTFPDAQFDKRSGRDKLVVLALELAA